MHPPGAGRLSEGVTGTCRRQGNILSWLTAYSAGKPLPSQIARQRASPWSHGAHQWRLHGGAPLSLTQCRVIKGLHQCSSRRPIAHRLAETPGSQAPAYHVPSARARRVTAAVVLLYTVGRIPSAPVAAGSASSSATSATSTAPPPTTASLRSNRTPRQREAHCTSAAAPPLQPAAWSRTMHRRQQEHMGDFQGRVLFWVLFHSTGSGPSRQHPPCPFVG